MGNDGEIYRSAIGRNGLPHLNLSGALSLDFCATHGRAIGCQAEEEGVGVPSLIGWRSAEAADHYCVARVVTKTKTQVWEEFREDIEKT